MHVSAFQTDRLIQNQNFHPHTSSCIAILLTMRSTLCYVIENVGNWADNRRIRYLETRTKKLNCDHVTVTI